MRLPNLQDGRTGSQVKVLRAPQSPRLPVTVLLGIFIILMSAGVWVMGALG